MNLPPPDYVVRSWTTAGGGRERITFVDMAGRIAHVTITHAEAVNGGAHQAIMARLAALGPPKGAQP